MANNNTVSDVSTGLGIPNAVKFNSLGILHGTDSQFGKVYRYDIDNPETETNRELVFQAPFNAIDNLIFDRDDRLYISSVNRGTILEVLLDSPAIEAEVSSSSVTRSSGGEATLFRTVVAGIFTLPCRIALLDGVVYTANPNGVNGYIYLGYLY